LGRRQGHEMSTAFKGRTLVYQTDVGFMDEGGRMQGVLAALAPKVGSRQAMQLVIDQRQDVIGGVFVATIQLAQQSGDFTLVTCMPSHIGNCNIRYTGTVLSGPRIIVATVLACAATGFAADPRSFNTWNQYLGGADSSQYSS